MTISEIRAKNLTRSGSLILISVGVLTLLGWAFNWRPILSWLPGSSLIICDSAFCLLLAGIGLFSAQGRSIWLPRLMGILLFVLGTTYFCNAIRQGDFTIHHFFPAFTRAAIYLMPVHAFRMAMGPSLAFLLLGILLILVSQKWPGRASFAVATVAAIAITAIGVLGVVVSVGGIAGDYGWSRMLLRMALPTAISTFVMGITCQSLLWVKLDATGPQLSSDAAYSALLGLLMLFGGVDSAIGINANEAIKARNDLATATTRINLIRTTVAAIREAESGQRGFLLTGEDDFRKAYREASEEALADSTRLQNETQTAKALCEAVQTKLAELSQTITLSQSGRRTEALATIRSRQGLFLMKTIEAQSNKLVNDLEAELRVHLNANETSLQRVRRTILISYALALLLSGFGFYLLRKENKRRTAVESELRESTRTLETKVAVRTLEMAVKATKLKEEVERRIATEFELSQTGERLRASLRFAKMAAWTWDPEADKVTWSGPVRDIFGFDGIHLSSYVQFQALIHPDDRRIVHEQVERSAREGCDYAAEFRIVRPNGDIRWVAGVGGAKFDLSGAVLQMAGVYFDISGRKLAEQQLEISERHFRQLAEAMPQIVWRATPAGDLDYCNARFTQYTGYTLDELTTLGCNSLVHPQDLPDYIKLRNEGFASGKPFELEYRLRSASDGAYRWFLTRSIPYQDEPHTLIHWFGTSTDIHEQKIAQDRLEEEVVKRTAELERSLDQLARSLREKETLLKEVHHRVKNNLQIISSLLRMQGHSVSDQRAASALQDSRQRVLSMALVHERLYGNQQMDHVDFAEYSQTLVNELFSSFYFEKAGRITAHFNLSHVKLAIDQAIPCGLILNELVTNALKYAYPHNTGGQISIDLIETEEGLVTLSVTDHGIGLPEAFDWKESKSMGLPIVDILATQIGGSFKVESKNGARFSVTFAREFQDAKAASAA